MGESIHGQYNANVMDDAKEIQSAQDKIIKVLEQQLCEDAISRAEANKLVDELARAIDDQNRHYPKRGRDIAIIARDIERLPSVTPTQKTKAEIIDDLIKEIEDAEKKFDDKGAHHVSAGFYYARKELEKMKGIK